MTATVGHFARVHSSCFHLYISESSVSYFHMRLRYPFAYICTFSGEFYSAVSHGWSLLCVPFVCLCLVPRDAHLVWPWRWSSHKGGERGDWLTEWMRSCWCNLGRADACGNNRSFPITDDHRTKDVSRDKLILTHPDTRMMHTHTYTKHTRALKHARMHRSTQDCMGTNTVKN